jgi:hypothetical protein
MSDCPLKREQAALAERRPVLASDMIRCVPSRYASFAFGIIQAGVTTGVATAVANLRVGASSVGWIFDWLAAWSLAWMAMLPIVALAAPLIQRVVRAITIELDLGSDARKSNVIDGESDDRVGPVR